MFISMSVLHRVLPLCAIFLVIPTLLEGIVPPKTPVLTGFEPAAIGTYRKLVCDAYQPDSGTISYTWYIYSIDEFDKDNWESKGPFSTNQNYTFNPVTETKVFHQNNAARSVNGKYKCRATNLDAKSKDSDWEYLYVYTRCANQAVSVTPPKPAVGGTFTLKCHIPKPTGILVSWATQAISSSQAVDVAQATSKNGCTILGGTRYKWTKCDHNSNDFNLDVNNAQTFDVAYWICKDHGLSCSSDPVWPVIQADPGTPQVIGFPSGPVAEGNEVNLNCSASPPGDTYDWYKDGTKVSTSLTYDFSVKKRSGGVYKCLARTAGGSATSYGITLIVYYKGDPLEVSSDKTSCHSRETDRFTCTATGGFPTPTLKIYIKRSGGTTVEVTQGQDRVMAKEDNQAEYYCEGKVAGYPALEVTSPEKRYSVTFPTTKVFFALGATVAVQVGKEKRFRCTTDESNPVASIKWYQHKGGSFQDVTSGITSFERNGLYGGKNTISDFSVTATKAMNGRSVRCVSSYSLTGHSFAKSNDTRMYVKWSATELKMIGKPNSPTVAGASVNITCETDSSNSGSPVTISWYRNRQQTTTGVTPGTRPATDGGTIYISQLKVTARNEDNQAKYECKMNDQANFKKDVTITVHYPPTVRLSPPQKPIKEGSNLTLTCDVTSEGNPKSYTYKWYYKDNEIQHVLTKTYKISAIAYTESGKYKCEAINDGGKDDDWLTIDVHYKPKWNPDLPELFTIASKPGESAIKFVLHVIATPSPTKVEWFFSNNSAVGVPFTATKVNETTYNLNKSTINDKDYGNYTVKVTNTIGVSSFVFHLTRTGPPLTPYCLRVWNATAISLTLAFKSNFSSGSPQTFNVQMKTAGGAWKDEVKVENDPGFGNDAIVKIPNLKSDAEYHFQVQSTNDDGNSGYGGTLKSRTKVAPFATLSVNRDGKTVSVSWQPLPERYTKVQIRYCRKRDGACAHFEIDQNKSSVSFPVEVGESYTFTLEILDGNDRIVASPVVSADPNGPSVAVIAGGVGGFLTLLIIVAVVLAVVFILKKRQADKGDGLMTPKKKSNGNSSQVNQGFNNIGKGTNKNGESVELMSPSSSIQMESNGGMVNKKGPKKPPVGDTYADVDLTKKKGGKKKAASSNQGGGLFPKGNKTPAMPAGDEYAQVDYSKKAAKNDAKPSEQGDVYAEVNKPKKPIKPTKPGKGASDDQAVYANVQNEEDIYEDVHDDREASGYKQPKEAYQVGVDGTLYAEVNIQPPRNPTVIKGSEEIEASYGSVDFSRQAPALKNADDPNDANFTELI